MPPLPGPKIVFLKCVCTHECRCTYKPEEGARSPGVLGTELGSFGKTPGTLTIEPSLQALKPHLLITNLGYLVTAMEEK